MTPSVGQPTSYGGVRGEVLMQERDDPWPEIVVLADLVAGDYEVPSGSRDPDDDKYLAAAVEGRAAFVVTGDPDLLDIGQYDSVRIVSPRQFLDLLDQEGPSERESD